MRRGSIRGTILIGESSSSESSSPVSLPMLHRLILEDKVGPDFFVIDEAAGTRTPLPSREDLIPYPELRSLVMRLYHEGDEDETHRWIERFLAFDPKGSSTERSNVQLVHALVLGPHDSEAARNIYEELLRAGDRRLLWVLHNNLAVQAFREGEVLKALEHIEVAVDAPEPLLAACLNFERIVRFALETGPSVLTGSVEEGLRRLRDRLKPIRETIGKAADNPGLREQLTAKNSVPGPECATLLHPDDVPSPKNVGNWWDSDRVDPSHCLELASNALQEGSWEAALLWTAELRRRCPEDSVALAEAARIERKAKERKAGEETRLDLDERTETLKRIRVLETRGDFEEALEEVARIDFSEDSDLKELGDRLRRKLAKYNFEEGRRLEKTDPAAAARCYLTAADHPEWEQEATSLARAMEAQAAGRRGMAALSKEDFESLEDETKRLGRIRTSTPVAAHVADELDERRADRELELAEGALADSDFDRTRELTLAAARRHPNAEAKANELLDRLAGAEVLSTAPRIVRALRRGDVERAIEILLELTPEQTFTVEARRLIDLWTIQANHQVSLPTRRTLQRALESESTDSLEDLAELISLAERLDPGCLECEVDGTVARLGERIFSVCASGSQGAFAQAGETLSPLVKEVSAARLLAITLARMELESRVEDENTRSTLLELVRDGYSALDAGSTGLAAQKLQHALRAAPYLASTEAVLAELFTVLAADIGRAEILLAREEFESAQGIVHQLVVEWDGRILDPDLRKRLAHIEAVLSGPEDKDRGEEKPWKRLSSAIRRRMPSIG